MTDTLQTLERALLATGYVQRGGATFEAPDSNRFVALTQSANDPAEWYKAVETMLRQERFRLAPIWSRYLIIVVGGSKTPDLSAAAAGFCRDVSKCRRLVVFADEPIRNALPFLPLPLVPRGAGTTGDDVEAIVARHFDSSATELVTAFLDDNVATSYVQSLAGSSGSNGE